MTTAKPGLVFRKGYDHCFGCGPENPIGLKLKVSWDGQKASAEFTPGINHAGFDDMVHGGILCALMEEVMSYVPFHQGILTVTGRMEARFRHPARPAQPLRIEAFATRSRPKLMETRCLISLPDGTVIAEGSAAMWVVGREGDR